MALVSLWPCSHAGDAAHRQIAGSPLRFDQDRDGMRATAGLEGAKCVAASQREQPQHHHSWREGVAHVVVDLEREGVNDVGGASVGA